MQNLTFNTASLRPRDASPITSRSNPQLVSRQIGVLFSAYRRDDFADAEGFVAQLGVILSEFDDEVVLHVTSPQTGLQRRMKWPPSLAEVLEACEARRDNLERMRRLMRKGNALPAPRHTPIELANVFVPSAHARFAELCERTKTEAQRFYRFDEAKGGLWVPRDWFETTKR